MVDPDDVRVPVVRLLKDAYADLSDGQRWTIAVVLAFTVAFVGFGLRQVPNDAAFELERVTLPGAASATSASTAQRPPAMAADRSAVDPAPTPTLAPYAPFATDETTTTSESPPPPSPEPEQEPEPDPEPPSPMPVPIPTLPMRITE